MFTCRMCGVLYKAKDRLLRHVRDKHPKNLSEFRWCTYKVGSSLKYRMHQHEKTKHEGKYAAAEDRKNRGLRTIQNPTLVIPASPVKAPLAVFQEFGSSLPTGAMTLLRSPIPITLGFEHHENGICSIYLVLGRERLIRRNLKRRRRYILHPKVQSWRRYILHPEVQRLRRYHLHPEVPGQY